MRRLLSFTRRQQPFYLLFHTSEWTIGFPLLLSATKLRQCNVFTPVCHSVHSGGVCLSACWDTLPPPPVRHGGHIPTCTEADTPLWADTRPRQTPPGQVPLPPQADTPRADTPPSGHCSGRYVSYWNAFLSLQLFIQ